MLRGTKPFHLLFATVLLAAQAAATDYIEISYGMDDSQMAMSGTKGGYTYSIGAGGIMVVRYEENGSNQVLDGSSANVVWMSWPPVFTVNAPGANLTTNLQNQTVTDSRWDLVPGGALTRGLKIPGDEPLRS